jgi:ketosteroid isomerase-like protein
MRLTAAALLAVAVLGAPTGPRASADAKTGPRAPAESIATLEDQVRAAERAFAKTMADRDHAAFASFVAEDAVFWGRTALRGKAAVAAGWKALYEGPQAPFSWDPERVAVIASGDLAISSGPVYDPSGKRTGTFNSTWRREADGAWKVLLDLGCPPCDCK